ncbi:MAG: DNA-binding response regulator [Phototrophicales bacterium]|nr:MAG: DNA-binding response regulator [Phototrophicales bacterium]RMG77211.1 MAG: DNA-binding response regulator [Chloroflexota bacterium]
MATSILVVDDDKEIVRLVRAYLEQAGYQVLVAYDGETALHMLRRERPHLVILDLMLPDRDGWDITRIVRANPNLQAIPIIMLTARVEDTDKIVGLELGADDYITKPFNPREVVARVRSVMRRISNAATVNKEQVFIHGELKLDTYRREVIAYGKPVDLTPTEFEILNTLMENPGYAFTRAELIERSLGYEYESLERSLDSHIKNLRKKIEKDPKDPVYIQTVYGVGYRFGGDGNR